MSMNKTASASYVRPTFADDEILAFHKCRRLIAPLTDHHGDGGFVDVLEHHSKWRFISHHDKILSSLSLDNVAAVIHTTLHGSTSSDDPSSSCRLHLPPMLFGLDIMRMQLGTATLQLSAVDALLCWAAQRIDEEVAGRKIEVIKVPQAKHWQKRQSSLMDESIRESTQDDWTYSSDYCCSLLSSCQPNSDGSARVDNQIISDYKDDAPNDDSQSNGTRSGMSDSVSLVDILPAALTGTIVRAASLQHHQLRVLSSLAYRQQQELLHATVDWSNSCKGPPTGSGAWTITSVPNSGVDYNMLRSRDQPILFYDEFVLYQDDLEDCGEVLFEAKIRVMPGCWFVLSKHYLRVDGILIRCRETRLFHNFADDLISPPIADHIHPLSPRIHMEVCCKELQAVDQGAEAGPWRPPPATGLGPPSMSGSLWGLAGKTMTHLLPASVEGDRYYTLTYGAIGEEQHQAESGSAIIANDPAEAT